MLIYSNRIRIIVSRAGQLLRHRIHQPAKHNGRSLGLRNARGAHESSETNAASCLLNYEWGSCANAACTICVEWTSVGHKARPGCAACIREKDKRIDAHVWMRLRTAAVQLK